MRSVNVPRALNTRGRLPEGVSKTQTLYVGRDKNGDPAQWGNPFVLERVLNERDLSLIPQIRLPHWARVGRKPNRAQVIALYALLLGVRLDRGERNLIDLCYADRGARKPFWPVCWCAPQPCHGDVLAICAYFYCHALTRGMMHYRAQGIVRDALLELDYRLPGHLPDNLKMALSETLRNEVASEEKQEAVALDIRNTAASEVLAAVEAAGGIWTNLRLRRACLNRLCRTIGIDGGQKNLWCVRLTSKGMSIEVHRELIDDTLDMVTRELHAAGWTIKDAGETIWRAPDA